MNSILMSQGIVLSIGLAVVGLVVAVVLIRQILAASAGNERMHEIAKAVQEGANAYLNKQMTAVLAIAALMFAAVWWLRNGATAAGFVVGALCSLLAGYIGMFIAVRANVRTAQAASVGSHPALRIAFNGGAVTGLLVVALGLMSVAGFYLISLKLNAGNPNAVKIAIDSLVGLALGSSLVSVFARLGGGIYTKAADVGADLVGKIEQNLNEDDPRNPATIADNVGDNVGDCAGMAADVFETYAVSLIGAVLVGFLTTSGGGDGPLVFPFVLCGLSIISS
jgi:K(+)-stimulated pyrophosphate-energized sodium pump